MDPRDLPGADVGHQDLARVVHEPLRLEAERALARGETVRLVEGSGEAAARVQTLILRPSLRAAQCSGSFVIRGTWSGTRLVADRGGHLLDTDGACFCRDCETAGGYTLDDDE